MFSDGEFWIGNESVSYAEPMGDKDTVITMTLDMDKHSVSYKIGDKVYGYLNAKCVKKREKYRFAGTISQGDDTAIELL